MLPMQYSMMSPQMWVFTDQFLCNQYTWKGPEISTSISPVSDYWSMSPIVEILDFVKYVKNYEISK